jgi:DinB superfamily
LDDTRPNSSPGAEALVAQLRDASDALIAIVERIDLERWRHVSKPGVWSPGKDAEHVADGAAYHQWLVRLSLGQPVPARPRIERQRLTAELSQDEVVDLLRRRTEDSANLVRGLSEEQLNLPARPPRARPRTLAQMIEGVLIGHYHAHRQDIESKLRARLPA